MEILRPVLLSRPTITLSGFAEVREALRVDDLRQALYDSAPLTQEALIGLHGAAHGRRRRIEQPLFSRQALEDYEGRLRRIVEERLAPDLAAGRGELVEFCRDVIARLFAGIAGIDLPDGGAGAVRRLRRYISSFSESATSANSTRDLADIARDVQAAWQAYLDEFLEPSIERRLGLLARAPEQAPADIVTILLRHDPGLSESALRQEATLYMTASVGTLPGVFVATFDELLSWWQEHPDTRLRDAGDLRFLQRAAWETIRLHPANPQHLRRAERRVSLSKRTVVEEGQQAFMDVIAANRDSSVFGASAGTFDPYRELPAGVAPWGLGFGAGIHVCMGQNLAGGTEALSGMLALILKAVLDRDPRPHPADPPRPATDTRRRGWASYPVIYPPLDASR
jgi:cytochrome P450